MFVALGSKPLDCRTLAVRPNWN